MESSRSTARVEPVYGYNKITTFMTNNPQVVGSALVIGLVYYVLFHVFKSNSTTSAISNGVDSAGGGTSTASMLGVIGLGLVCLHFFLKIVFGIDVTASASGIFTDSPKFDIVVDRDTTSDSLAAGIGGALIDSSTVPRIRAKKQVFNIPGNQYTYENADAVCRAYDSRLATYSEIEKSYVEGGEWCNYGWSDGQMALFPTQQKTFDALQAVEGHKNDCGRPGVNGGFIDNANVKYGVNCFGYKPKITSAAKEMMNSATPYPRSAKDIAFQDRVDFWKKRINDILVSPFNHDSWGQI